MLLKCGTNQAETPDLAEGNAKARKQPRGKSAPKEPPSSMTTTTGLTLVQQGSLQAKISPRFSSSYSNTWLQACMQASRRWAICSEGKIRAYAKLKREDLSSSGDESDETTEPPAKMCKADDQDPAEDDVS